MLSAVRASSEACSCSATRVSSETCGNASSCSCQGGRRQSLKEPYIKNVVLFEENSILPLPERLEASGVKSVWDEVSQESPKKSGQIGKIRPSKGLVIGLLQTAGSNSFGLTRTTWKALAISPRKAAVASGSAKPRLLLARGLAGTENEDFSRMSLFLGRDWSSLDNVAIPRARL